ncbi:MAG: DNA polymerase III subunit gamma/tau [Nitrospira sp.]|nr:DNA polymerase III subunit gamma/tau [Nitrospira sp.]
MTDDDTGREASRVMDYQVSARKFRPGAFDELIGQTHVVQTLRNAILHKQVAHAYLFSGMRGVGKTTAARIVAKALNCETGPTPEPCGQCGSCLEITHGNSVDVIEIDGASNTGVDDVRELRENVQFSPFRGTYRIYIIDEVHMLSNSAFNALLKTLEEPPPHAVFIFATTEVQKIPATITSRCQHFNFRRIPWQEIVARLQSIAQHLGVTVEARSLGMIARASEGSLRDALSLFDQAVAFGETAITEHDVEVMLGTVPEALVSRLVNTVVNQDPAAAVALVGEAVGQGHDLRACCGAVVERVRHLMIAAVVPGLEQAQGLMDLPVEEVERVMQDAGSLSVAQLQELFDLFTQAEDRLRSTAWPRFVFEVAAVRAAGALQGRVAAPQIADVPDGHRQRSGNHTASDRQKPAPGVPSDQGVTDVPDGHRQRSNAPVGPGTSAAGVSRLSSPQPPVTPARQDRQPDPSPTDRPGRGAGEPAPGPGAPLQPKPVASDPPPERSEVAVQRGPDPAPARTVPPQPHSPAGSPVIQREQWVHVMEAVCDRHPDVGVFLEGGVLVKIEGSEVVVGFARSSSLACSMIQKEANRSLIAQVCREVTGATIRLCVVELTDEPGVGCTIKQVREQQRKQDDEALLEHVRENPVVKRTRDLFGVDVVKASRVLGTKEA